MRRMLAVSAALVSGSGGLMAQGPDPLPVQKVVLYKNGMGYFQHLGSVRDDAVLEMALPSSQLDDALKSLTLLDLDGGRISGVTYDSEAPLARRLEELSLTPAETLAGFLNQIRGSRIQAGAAEGRLLAAEVKLRREGEGVHIQVLELSIASEGEVKLVELERAGGFRVLDPELAGDLNRALELLAGAKRTDLRRLKIQTRGSGNRRVFVSYTAEAPIWKTTYRIVLDPKQKALLQGWAIVDNTSALDWKDVELSLVSGAPVSFIQTLSQPIYGQRPVIPVAGSVSAAPRTYEQTMQRLEDAPSRGKAEAEHGRNRSAGSLMELSSGLAAAPSAPPPPDLGEAVRRAAFETAAGAALGEQFEYRLPQPVTVRRNQSALLSILQAEVEAEKVSVYRESDGGAHPRLAIWLDNSSGATLDGGAYSVIDSNAFAGEGVFETVQPQERRLLSYAIDLAVNVDFKLGSEQKRVERVVIRNGTLRMYRKAVETKTYTVRNNADKARSVIIEHPVRGGWSLTGEAKPEETSANSYRFRVPAPASSTVRYEVREERPDQSVFAVTNINSDLIAVWAKEKSIDAATEKSLREIARRQAEIAELEAQLKQLDEEVERIFADQKRVRDNLARLGTTPDESRLRQRYVDQLNGQEDRLGQLGGQRDGIETSRDAKKRDLDRFIQELDFDREI